MAEILPQNPPRADRSPVASWQRQHMQWLAAAVLVPLSMTLTAYGVVEFGPQVTTTFSTVTQTLPTPELRAENGDASLNHVEVIRSGDSLSRLLARMGVIDSELQQFIQTDPTARKLYELSPGRFLQASTRPDGLIREISYVTSKGEEVRIGRENTTLTAQASPAQTQTQTFLKSGRINSSFFAATDAADIPDAITQQLIELFASRVDFHHKLQKGDQFTVIYDAEVHQGSLVRPGKILGAQFISNGVVHEAMWYADGSPSGNYYTLDGASLKQGFISSPVKFSRVSSGFGMRFHPVMFDWKQHRGVDYAAPTGTEIMATADGVITKLAREAGYGNVIEIRHDGRYSTLYAHMNAFAPGLKVGSNVTQGQIIGEVGSTGRSTGPHLHYEFKINGEQVDPLAVKLPEGKKLTNQQLLAFGPVARSMKRQLSIAGQVELAQLD